jgi:hypothetical protein
MRMAAKVDDSNEDVRPMGLIRLMRSMGIGESDMKNGG